MRGSWLRKWFGGHGPGDAEALQALLTQICQQETALACHRILAMMDSYVMDCP